MTTIIGTLLYQLSAWKSISWYWTSCVARIKTEVTSRLSVHIPTNTFHVNPFSSFGDEVFVRGRTDIISLLGVRFVCFVQRTHWRRRKEWNAEYLLAGLQRCVASCTLFPFPFLLAAIWRSSVSALLIVEVQVQNKRMSHNPLFVICTCSRTMFTPS
jgi:hypothetical protein